MSVVSIVVAVCVFALALVWVVVGVAGLRGTLRRNRWLGVRSTETLQSDEAFVAANRVAAPGTLGAAVILIGGGLLTLGVDSGWSILFGFGALVAALVIVGMVSGVAVRSVRWMLVEHDAAGCSCCSGGDAHAADTAPAAGATTSAAANAADCGESSCGACTLRDACSRDTAVQA
ncbi:SdpI family protein [Gordonia sp. NPDC003376]